jgi:predicted ATPase/DNA-binding CsgD family transcriptional regulator
MFSPFPAQPTPFVGRTKELGDLTARLENPEIRLITLTGLGGSGKTRLAIESANRVASHFPHGTIFVGLQPLTKSNLLVHTIAQALSLTLYGEAAPETQLFDYLHEKSLLLLLDNFEHLLESAALISTILAHAPRVKILITSREALNLQEEWLYPLKGMSTPLSADATALEDYEAVQLFLYHARRIHPDFELASEPSAVMRICELTAGLPLAIELAASWLRGLTASQIAVEMQCNLDFLVTTTRNVEERHRSMRAVFDQSWKLLAEDERLIFAQLSVFRGGFDHEAADQVAGASLSILAALVEKSLVQMESANRFGIHELLCQYSMEKLEAYGQIESTYARHSRYFAQQMLEHETALKQAQQLETMQAIEHDFENIRLAWEWAAKHEQLSDLHAMLNGLYLFGFLGRRHVETIILFQHTLEQSIANVPLLGRLLTRRWGYLHWWYQSDYQEALTSIEQALTIALSENNRFEMAFGHLMAAYAMMSMRRYADALPHLETSKALFEDINEPYYVCWVLHRLGYVYSNLNDLEKSNEYTEQSFTLAQATHNRFALVICLYNLGSSSILYGDYIKGAYYGTEALQCAAESGHPCLISHALSLLALHAFLQGDYTTCLKYAEDSQTIIKDIVLLVIQPYSLALLVLLACLREDYAEGVRLSELAKQYSSNAIDFQLLYWALATLSCGLGSPTDVRMYIQKLLYLSDSGVNPTSTLWIVPSLAYLLIETEPEKAVELLSWILAYGDSALSWVRHWPLIDRLQTQLQAVMDVDTYQRHWQRGQALTFEVIDTYLHQEFHASAETVVEAPSKHYLTGREREILRLMAEGMTNPQIAAQLVIGAGTVKTHTLNIYRKLEVANRTQAIVRAQELGLLPLTEINLPLNLPVGRYPSLC